MPVLSLTTTRRDGHLREPKALASFLKKKKWPRSVATAQQVHGVKIARVTRLSAARHYAGADGLLTDVPNQPLGIFTADCVPLFLRSTDGSVVGVLHAGWRGVRGEILRLAVRHIKKRWAIPATRLHVWAGPFIQPCCFEVQWDVARYFPHARRRFKDRWTVDLGRALRHQAKALGVRWLPSEPKDCTRHDTRWHSYRRDQTTQRQVSLIMKTPPVVQ